MGQPNPYLDGLLKLVLRIFGNGTFLTNVGGGTTGINVQSPLTATPNPTTQNVDLGVSNASGAWSFPDITLPPESAPANPSSGWTLYVDVADGLLKARDASGSIVVMSEYRTSTTGAKTFNANNTSASVNLFQITGVVKATLWGSVTVAVGSNHTASQFRMSDGSNNSIITAASSTPLSNAPVNSMIMCLSGSSHPSEIGVFSSATPIVGSNGSGEPLLQEVILGADASTSYVQYLYTTTNTPGTGAGVFNLRWAPLTSGAAVTSV